MLPATIQTWTYTGRDRSKSVETSSVPNGNETFSNLLRTRKCFTTSHMHIYSIPPMSRMNSRQKIVPKLLCSDFIHVFSLMVETTFLETTTSYRTFWTQTPFEIIKSKKDRCKQLWIRPVYTWVENGPCTAVRSCDPGRWTFRSTSEANVSTVIRFFQTLFHKIHDSYHNL